MSSTNSPCAACKMQRKKCTPDCAFAPYFPADDPQKFAYVHKVFGASNVAKILNDLNEAQREDAVKSLAYEAEARLRDPVYGCVGLISVLQQRLNQLQIEFLDARKELAAHIGRQALLSTVQPPGSGLNLISTYPTHMMMGFDREEPLGFNDGGGGFQGDPAPGPTDLSYQIEAQHRLQAQPHLESPLLQKSEAGRTVGPFC